MEYRDNARIDASEVVYAGKGGSGRRGPGIALGGGAGVLVLLVALLFNVDLGALTQGDAPVAPQTGTVETPHCQTGADIKQDRRCRWAAQVNSIQRYWRSALPGYKPAKLVIFSGRISTACGTAGSEVGPFYCPGDQQVYMDPGFTEMLLKRLGARGGDAAEAYILAHEYGHHVSNLTGTLARAQSSRQQTGPKSAQTRLELQADCYAGVWFANTVKDPNSLIQSVTADDLERVVDAARAVGDDHIQMQSTGGISPESWTHGSSAMRKHWVTKGFQSGDPNVCDTFSTDDLGE